MGHTCHPCKRRPSSVYCRSCFHGACVSVHTRNVELESALTRSMQHAMRTAAVHARFQPYEISFRVQLQRFPWSSTYADCLPARACTWVFTFSLLNLASRSQTRPATHSIASADSLSDSVLDSWAVHVRPLVGPRARTTALLLRCQCAPHSRVIPARTFAKAAPSPSARGVVFCLQTRMRQVCGGSAALCAPKQQTATK